MWTPKSRTHRNMAAIGICSAAVLASLAAVAKLGTDGAAQVRFDATGPAGLKIDGTESGLSATEDGDRLVVSAPTGEFKTGIGLRDKHLRRYLEAEKHAQATLRIERAKLSFPKDSETTHASATGELTLHGVTKPLKFSYSAKRAGTKYAVDASARLDIRDFGIEVPCYLGVCVKPDVGITLEFGLNDK